MTDQRKIRFMKITCWIGIAADALWAIAFIFPSLYGALAGIPNFDPGIQLRISLGIAGSLMSGWTFLLLWAVQKPVERKEVMLLTAFPVIIGLFITSSAQVFLSLKSFESIAWILIKLTLLIVFFTTSYIFGRQLSQKD